MKENRLPLFNSKVRTDRTVGLHQESTFDFLDRMGGPYWEATRQLMQEWLDRIHDDADYQDLRRRLQSSDNEQFRSAFLELYLHESLWRAGYRITVHPHVPNASKRPDFLAERGDDRMYIEAISPGTTPSGKAAASRRAVLFDTVDRLHSTSFFLWLDELIEGEHPPRAAKLRSELASWLASLNPRAKWSVDEAPSYDWADNGWFARFKAIPKRPKARDQPFNSRAIGVYSHGRAQFVDDAPTIRAALATKHHRYGDLGAPYVIAVGTYIQDSDLWHATNALYGTYAVSFDPNPDNQTEPREFRYSDGYFGSPPDWQNHGVSGVLLINQLQPYSVPQTTPDLWHHPSPWHPLLSSTNLPWRTMTFDGDAVTESLPTEEPHQFFGLPRPWPPGEAWPRVQQ